MTAGVDRFRRIACGLPGAVEGAHMGNPDFRVGGRIFATLSGQARGRGVLKLTAELLQSRCPVQGHIDRYWRRIPSVSTMPPPHALSAPALFWRRRHAPAGARSPILQ